MGKDYMNAITHGVYVIGAKNGEKKNLMTAAWLTQISSRPNQILVAVSAGHYTAEMLQNNAHFTISVLAKGQEEVAKACGFVSGRNAEKTELVACIYDEKDCPIVKDSAAYMICEVNKVYQLGDHVLFAAEVLDGENSGKEPMVYHKADFFG